MSVPTMSQNANALIVGATRGIGLGFVRALIERKNIQQIYCTYRDPSTGEELFELQRAYPDRVVCLQMDVTDESQIASALQRIGATSQKLQLAIFCAGVLHEGVLSPEKSLRDVNSENLMTSFKVNSMGAVLVAKHLAPLFDRHSDSIFACISAKVGSIGDNRLGGWYGYRASKSALNMFVRTIAIEYRHRCPKTVVVALHPGTTDTELSEPFQQNVPKTQLSTVGETVGLLLNVMSNLTPNDSGEFYSWNGDRLPW